MIPGTALRLVPVREEDVGDDALIALLSAWRARYMEVYPTQFRVTDERTRAWLRDVVVGDPARLMFVIRDGDDRPVGHVGLDRIDLARRCAVTSNFMAGDRDVLGPRGVGTAAHAMLVWARAELGLEQISSYPFADNVPSVRMLRRIGGVEVGRVPLRRHAHGERVEFRPVAPGDDAPADRWWIHLVHPAVLPTGPLGLGPVGLGTAGTGPAGRDGAADATRAATFAGAVRRGIDWVDTAAIYGLGHVERQLGGLLAALDPDARPRVVTKCGLRWDERAGRAVVSDPGGLEAEADASRDRLGVERLDVLLLHRPPRDPDALAAAWSALGRLADAGVAAHVGLSNPSAEALAACHAQRPVDVVQLPCSPLRPRLAGAARDRAAALGVPVVAHGILELGALVGDLPADRLAALPAADRRRRPAALDAAERRRAEAALPALRGIAAAVPCTLAELAAAWVLGEPDVTAVAIGMSDEHQVDEVASAGLVLLDDDQRRAVREALA